MRGLLSRSFGESAGCGPRRSILKDGRRPTLSGDQNYAEQYLNNLEQLDGALRPRVRFSEQLESASAVRSPTRPVAESQFSQSILA